MMTSTLFRLIVRFALIISLGSTTFHLLGGTASSCKEPCYDPNAKPVNNNIMALHIDRTFLEGNRKFNKRKRLKSSVNVCVTPALNVSISRADLEAMLAEGNESIYVVTEFGQEIQMNVGSSGDATQNWMMPEITPYYTQSHVVIDSSEAPLNYLFDTTNLVLKGYSPYDMDTSYIHYKISDSLLQLYGITVPKQPFESSYYYDTYETMAFLPIECGWYIEEEVTSYIFSEEIDSLKIFKALTLFATGYFTPVNEDPVPAISAYVEHYWETYKGDSINDNGFYDTFEWFTTKGHRLIGFLKETYTELPQGNLTFIEFNYSKVNPLCADDQDLGTIVQAGTYQAGSTLKSGAQLFTGPVQFKARNSVELKPGFSTSFPFEAIIDPNTCLE